MKKGLLSRIFAVGALVAMLVGTFSVIPAQAVVSNTLVKGSGPAVYWYASNGKRYVFPNAKTFYTWFTANDFGRVQTVSDYQLSLLPLGGNVTYRPGSKLIKVTTDPRVYAISRYGTLRWITSESVARAIYGSNWQYQIEDVPDAYFVNYTTGNPIYSSSDFNASNEYYAVTTPSDNIRDLWNTTYVPTPSYQYPTYPTYQYPTYPSGYPNYGNYGTAFNSSTYVSGSITNRWMSGDQEAITYTATVSGSNTNSVNSNIRIIDEYTGNELGRCNNALTCTATLASRDNKTVSIYSRATDQYGYAIESSRLSVTYGRSNWYSNPWGNNNGYYNNNNNYNTNFTGSARVIISPSNVTENQTVSANVYIDTVSANISNVRVDIYDVSGNRLVNSCSGTWNCASGAQNVNGRSSIQYYAILRDQYGNTLPTIYSNTVTVSPIYNPPVYPPVYPPYYPPQQTFSVSSVTASVSPSYNTCGTDVFTFTGSITATAAGTVSYTWERSDGALSPTETVTFDGAGTRNVSTSWTMSAGASGWQRLHVLAPTNVTSNMATFSHDTNCWYY